MRMFGLFSRRQVAPSRSGLLLFAPEAAHRSGLGVQMRSTLVLIGAFGVSAFTSAAIAATACERLGRVVLDHAVVTDARLVPEGPGEASTTPGGPPPPMLPVHCRVQLDLKPTSDSLIKMEVWLPPADKWNGKFLGAGNGGFAGSIQGLRSGMPVARVRARGRVAGVQGFRHSRAQALN